MLLSAICFGVLALVNCAPTAIEFPEGYFGTYESQPESDQNFAEFNKGEPISAAHTGIFSIRRDGEEYVATVSGITGTGVTHIRFKLGETRIWTCQTTGKTMEYVYTVETIAENPVLKGKFRDPQSDFKFTADATFTPAGVNVTYAREGVTAKRTYIRIINPTIGGFYENVPEKQSPNFIEFANRIFPAPTGLSWDSNSGLWLGRWAGKFVVKKIVSPTIAVEFPFHLNQKHTKLINGKNVTYIFTLAEENTATNTTTLRGEMTTETETLVLVAVITPEGINTTYTAGDQTATRYWKRVLSPMTYGTFENVPEAAENWPAFIKATGTEKDDETTQRTKVQIYKQGTHPHFRVLYENGKTMVFPFDLNKNFEAPSPKGLFKYSYTEVPSYTNDFLMSAHYETAGQICTILMTFNATGIHAVYRAAGVVAQRFYRRVIPAYALGKFESDPATPEFIAFTESSGMPGWAKKTTIEFTETPARTYSQTFTIEGVPEPIILPYVLGQLTNTTWAGKTTQFVNTYFDYPVPVFHAYWIDAKNIANVAIAAEFNPTGYTATYMTNGKFGTRKYTRVGAPVERETFTTA